MFLFSRKRFGTKISEDIRFLPVDYAKFPGYFVIQHTRPESLVPVFPKSFFEESEKAWRSNKVRAKGRYWRYGCLHLRSKGRLCKKPRVHSSDYCSHHYKKYKKAGIEI